MKSQRFLQSTNLKAYGIFLLVLMGCESNHKMDVQGHRGCRGLLPENSLPAFEKAIDLGVHTLELDIVITKDQEVIVSHEPYMNEIICLDDNQKDMSQGIGKAFNLYEMTYEEIKAFDCGTKFHPRFPEQIKQKVYKPRLSEVFRLVKLKGSEVRFNIEIKSKPEYYGIYTPRPKAYVDLVLQVLKDHDMLNRTSLQSFDLRILEEIHNQAPETKIALLVDEDETIAGKLSQLSFVPEIISPYYKLLTLQEIENYKAKEFEIIPWTINAVEDMERFIAWEVDGIITDYPDRLLNLLK